MLERYLGRNVEIKAQNIRNWPSRENREGEGQILIDKGLISEVETYFFNSDFLEHFLNLLNF